MSHDPAAPNPGPIPFPASVELSKVRKIHVLGVAGTGMGSFAGMLKASGYQVTGSDQDVYPPMSEKLGEWGISVMSPFSAENLEQAQPDLVVVGNVIRKTNPEATAMRERALPHASFPAALGEMFLKNRRSVVVAGTHGKTTTTSLLAHLLAHAGRDPSMLVGGVPKNFGDSYRLGSGEDFVLEGDEYDTAYFDKGPKFVHYLPKILQFTGAEFDHADIYRDMEHYESSFRRLFQLLPPEGFVAACSSFANTESLIQDLRCPAITYSASRPADLQAKELVFNEEGAFFRAELRGESLGDFHLPMSGLYNVDNALGALAIGLHLGIDPQQLASGLRTFEGVRRRQELVSRANNILLIDDFAHHPTAVAQTVAGVHARYPERKIWALFEPRSNTASRQIHQAEYQTAFSKAHQVLIATPRKIANLSKEEQLDVSALCAEITKSGIPAQAFENASDIAAKVLSEVQSGDLVLVMSNGAFGGLVGMLKEGLEGRDGAPGSL